MAGESQNSRSFCSDQDAVNKPMCQSKKLKNRFRMTPYSSRPSHLPEGAANEELTETEGERHLRWLLDQQLDTQLTLHQQYQRHRTFQPSSTYIPITRDISGKMSSTAFQACELQKQHMDELREMGLDGHELALKLQHSGSYEKERNSFGQEPSILKQQLDAIEIKLDMKKAELLRPDTFRDAKQLSRHEMDLEKSLKPTSHQAQLLRSLLTVKRTLDEIHPAHPINHLKDLERDVLKQVHHAHLEVKGNLRTFSSNHQLAKTDIHQTDQITKDTVDAKATTAMDTLLLLRSKLSKSKTSKGSSASESEIEPKTDLLLTKKNHVVHAYIVPISEEEIKNNRLSLEQIQKIPRFNNYNPGERSETLYLKNLASDVTEADLIALFSRYEKNLAGNLVYRLMKGRMKGQAFVKFPNVEVAAAALDLMNGFMWKGKPIIIQYGRRDN